MLRTIEILDKVAEITGSDYATAKRFGITPQSIYSMRKHGTILSPEHGLIAADILQIEAEFILLSITAERGFTSPAYKELEAIANRYAPDSKTKKAVKVAAGLVILAMGAAPFFDAINTLPMA